MKAIFFDLDGTLIDSKEGLFKSIIWALEEGGYPVPSEDILIEFLGPPIVDSLQTYCGMTEEEAETTYAKFGERYSREGKFECTLYDGIEQLLVNLKAKRFFISLATAKPEVYAREILTHFGIAQYFDNIVGSDYSVGRREKQDVLAKAIEDFGGPEHTPNGARAWFMVGDRRYDMEAAIELGAIPLGVTYGFGTAGELNEAGAEYLADEPVEIEETVDLEEMLHRARPVKGQ